MNRRLDFSPRGNRPDLALNAEKIRFDNHRIAQILARVSPDDFSTTDDTAFEKQLHTLRGIQPPEFSGGTFSYNWDKDRRLSGQLLTTLDAAISAAKERDIYYDSSFSEEMEGLLHHAKEGTDNPLIRRKLAAIEQRSSEVFAGEDLPRDPKLLREVFNRFPFAIHISIDDRVAYLDDLLKRDPDYLSRMDDATLLAQPWKTYFTGDEGYVEFITRQRLAQRDIPAIPHPKELPDGIVAQLAPGKYGAFDAIGRFRGMVDGRRGTLLPLAEDADIRLLSLGTSFEDIAADTAFAFDLGMRDQFSKDFGFDIAKLNLQEQVALIGVMRDIDAQEEKRIIDVIHHYGIDAARSFLATAIDAQARDAILAIGDNHPESEARQIFRRFSEIADAASLTAKEVAVSFTQSGDLDVDVGSIRTELLMRGTSMLQETAAQHLSGAGLKQALEHAKADIALFATVFRLTRKQHPEIGFDDLRGVHLESLETKDLQDADRAAMETIASQNWRKQKPEIVSKILDGLRTAMMSADTRFYVLRKDNDIAAFIRFDTRDDGTLYGASLNVNPTLRGSGIGESMMHASIDEMARDHVIAADVFPELPVGMKYVEEFGCVITGVETVTTENGKSVERFTLERDDLKNRHYKLRDKPHTKLSSFGRVMRFDTSKGTQDMLSTVRQAAHRGEVATRYYSEDAKGTVRYLAFEPAIILSKSARAA